MDALENLDEYLELIDYNEAQDLYKVFMIFYNKVEFSESDSGIYNFYETYQKQLVVLDELEIIEYDYDDDDEEYFFETYTSQLEMAKLNKCFQEHLNNFF